MNRHKMVVIENSRDGYECTNDQVSEGARQRGNETLECKWGSTRCLTSLVGEEIYMKSESTNVSSGTKNGTESIQRARNSCSKRTVIDKARLERLNAISMALRVYICIHLPSSDYQEPYERSRRYLRACKPLVRNDECGRKVR